MKKLFVIFFIGFFSLNAFALYNSDITNGCTESRTFVPVFQINSYNCASGQYLPANALGCQSCTYGHTCVGGTYTFDAENDQGITIGTYTCNSGYYLPANAAACVACPSNATCSGGTFTFNTATAQGIRLNYPISQNVNYACSEIFAEKFVPVFQINSYNCASGQYLPADALACTSCPNGYTCAGGTFEYNPTTNQGIIANTITINWHGALAADINANDAGTVIYGGDIRTPVRPDPAQIPVGQRFKGWRFSKPTQGE